MMDPLSAIVGIGGGLLSYLGGQQANAANAQQAAQANIFGFNEQLEAQQYNAVEAAKARQFTGDLFNQSQAFNSSQAERQMVFQDTEMNKAMEYNTAQAGVQRDYETSMANTAYQRAVRDMKAAGLNPILSAGTGGSATPQVSSPSISAPSGASGSVGTPGAAMASSGFGGAQMARMSDVISPAVSTAYQTAQLSEQLRNMQANRLYTNQREDESNANTDVAAQTRLNLQAQHDNIVRQGKLIDAQTGDTSASARQKDAATENVQADTRNKLLGPSGGPWNPNVIRSWLPDVGSTVGSGVSWLTQHDPLSWWSPSMPSTAPPNPGAPVVAPAVKPFPYGVMSTPKDAIWGPPSGTAVGL